MLRTTVERIIGILKRRWKILRTPPEYSMEVQVNLVLALTAIHNYIRIDAGVGGLEAGLEEVEVPTEIEDDSPLAEERSTRSMMDNKRQEMAAKMWEDYISVGQNPACD